MVQDEPVALASVYKVYKAVKIPIIGIGGISNYSDVIEFFLCGASAVQIGTALFVEPDAPVKIIKGLEKYLTKKKISEIRNLTGQVRIYK